MTKPLESITISKKKARGMLLLAIFVFGLYQYQYNSDAWTSFWRLAKRSEAGQLQVQIYAGCQLKSEIQNSTDEEFTRGWTTTSKAYDFTYEDVRNSMFEHCPPKNPEALNTDVGQYSLFHSESEKEVYNVVLHDNLQYQFKFLNREFSVLKEFKK